MDFDRSEILRTWHVFRQPGEILEVRVPKAGKYKIISGYFDDPGKLADAVIGIADRPFAGIYFTVNPVKRDLLARASNRIVKYAETTTSDADIIALHWLPVDLDAKKPAGISSTDLEHEAAISVAREIRHWLIEWMGWPENAFVLADSGNGGHLNIRIGLPNEPENIALVKRCLETLDFIFSNDLSQVDTTSQNPSRIWKLYGTMARKGDNTQERPHRMARVLEVPGTPETVTREKLEALAAMLPRAEEAAQQQPRTNNGCQGFDPAVYCQDHGLQVHHTKTWTDPGGIKCTVAVLEQCVFNPDHHLSAVIIGWPNGMKSYRCRHHSCLDKKWKDAKAVIEGEYKAYEPHKATQENPSAPELKWPKLEDLTKAIGRMEQVDPKTGEAVTDPETGTEIIIPKLTLSPSKASTTVANIMQLRISTTDKRDTPKLWQYDGGIWLPDGEKQVVNLIDAVIGDLSYERGLRETLRRVRALSDTVTFDGDPCMFPALDGVIDLRTGRTRDFRPEDYITFKYGVLLTHPKADFRLPLWVLCSTLPDPRDVLTALDIITAAVIRLPFEVIIQLIGPGGNGKGIFEKMMIALCTADRVAAVTLLEAKASRFGPGALLGKDLWILSEVEDVKSTINLLKKVSTGEMVDSDQKYGDRIRGKPHVLPVLDCNNAIDFGDDSWGRKRRVIKLDFPYTFDYAPDTRPKDPHLEEKVTSSAALAGLLQIIAARAPYLCKSMRIYNRKRPEEMAEEYQRQQFSLHYFCEECLGTTWLQEDEQPLRLKTDAAFQEYLEYCKLFHVPVPAAKGQFSGYIAEKYKTQSKNTSEIVGTRKIDYRYYPGLYLVKSAKLAYGEAKIPYYDSYDNPTTDLRQRWLGENDSFSSITTATTEKLLSEVVEEIERMFKFIEGCKDPREISYENYLKNPVVAVVGVVMDQGTPIFPTTSSCNAVVEPVVEERWCSGIKADLQRAEERRRRKDEHFRRVATRLTSHARARQRALLNYRPILVLEDLGEIAGLDGMGHTLFTQDVITLPEKQAQALIARGVARAIQSEAMLQPIHDGKILCRLFPKRAKEADKGLNDTSKEDSAKNVIEPICAVCGSDLAGKGQILKNGKAYCATPGCGYPPRRIGETEA